VAFVVPHPNAAQITAFARHLVDAHSWYRHLPLIEGGDFVLFLAHDAGGGYERTERLHYGWRTTPEYRQRFGHLDYAWRVGNGRWWRDAGRDHGFPEDLPSDVIEAGTLTLYPYCSVQSAAPEAIGYGIHAADLARLREGCPHPDRDLVLEWARRFESDEDVTDVYAELQRSEMEAIERTLRAVVTVAATVPVA
jgi:hypothetical protein